MGKTVQVPAILLSASAEYKIAYGPAGNRIPVLSRISEDDERVKESYWYQPPVDAQHLRNHNSM